MTRIEDPQAILALINENLRILLMIGEGSPHDWSETLQILINDNEIDIEYHGGQKYLDDNKTLNNPKDGFQMVRNAVGDGRVEEYKRITSHWTLADYYLLFREALTYYAEQQTTA